MDLNTLLHQAVTDTNAAVQEQAQQLLRASFNADPKNFMLSLTSIVSNEQQADSTKQAAGIVISRSLLKILSDNKGFLWTTLQLQITSQIKTFLLETLNSEEQLQKTSAFAVISKIAAIDVPSGKWDQLLPILLKAVEMNDVKIKKTAVRALKFICREFKQHKIVITFQQTEQILMGIYLGLVEPKMQMKRQALKALGPFIIYINDILKSQQGREKIMIQLFQCFNQPTLVQPALEVILEYAKYYYQFLGQIIPSLYKETSKIIKKYGVDTVSAVELWQAIAEQYLKRKHIQETQNYILGIGDDIVKMLLMCLLQCEKGQENCIKWAAYAALCPICQGCEAMCLESVCFFVSNVITSNNWKFRQASSVALFTIINTDNQSVKQWLQKKIDQLFKLLRDADEFVVQQTVAGLVRILKKHQYAKMLLQRENAEEYIGCFIQLLNRQQHIVVRALEALKNLIHPLLDHNKCNQALFSVLNYLTKFILSAAPVPFSKMKEVSLLILHIINKRKVDQKILKYYMQYLMQKCALLEDNKDLQSCLLVILHSSVLATKGTLQPKIVGALSRLVHSHFKQINTVDKDGLYLIAAMAINMRESFYPHFSQLGPYVEYGLALKDQPPVYQLCIGVVSDICRAIGKRIPSEIDRYLSEFINRFQAEGEKHLKGLLLEAVGDLIRAVERYDIIAKHVNNVMQIAKVSVFAYIQLTNSGVDPDYAEYIDQKIIMCLQSLCSGFIHDFSHLLPSVLDLTMTLVLATCKKQANPTLHHLKICFFLTFDIGCCLSNMDENLVTLAKSRFSQPAFREIFNSFSDIQSDNQVNSLQTFSRAVFYSLGIH